MILNSKARRRRFGVVCLAAAAGMLVAGETVLKDRLSALGFILYWFGCFGFTILAILTALADARALRQEGRDEQRALLKDTIAKIEKQKRDRR